MSYQDYQYSWPTDSYDYSHNTSHAQYTSANNSQGQYTPADHFPSSSTQDYQQYETSFSKPQTDSGEYSGVYPSNATPATVNMDLQYGQDQYSQYSAPAESSYQSLPYQYSNSQASHDSPNTSEMAYVNDTSFNSSYQYSKPPPSQMETQASNHSYSGDMDCGYTPGGDNGQESLQPNASYVDDYGRSTQYSGPTSSYSGTYYPGNDNHNSGGAFAGDDGMDANSGFPGDISNNASGGSTSNYVPHEFEDSNSLSYSVPSYQSRGQGYAGYNGGTYGRPGERRQGHNVHVRGGRMNRSTFSSSGGSSSHSFGNSYNNKPSQGNINVSREASRGGEGHQFTGNRYANSRSRDPNAHSSNPRSRGSSSTLNRGSAGFSRGSTTSFNRGAENYSRGASNFNRGATGSRFNSTRGNSFQNRGSNSAHRGGQRRGSFTKFPKESNSTEIPQDSEPSRSGARLPDIGTQGRWKTSETTTFEKKEKIKAPSRPQDKLLNEIEEREKEEQRQKERKAAEEKEKAEIARKSAAAARKAEEDNQKKIMEETRQKAEDMAKKKAPPSKLPETPEEIAREEEIQRKIRESLVVVDPVKEMALLTDDPTKEIEMPEELRKLLKTLTSDTFCKLCSLRMIGPHMAPMHYNGKNHLKKVRTFVQTNGRSAGFNMETVASSEEEVNEEKKEGETDVEEEMEVDEKKYCKICKVSFSHGSQYEMHYKGKNHAKKVRSLANSTEIFECKLCCVTVTAQEHLTAHLNGARHKLQMRKNNRADSMRSRGGLYGRGGRGGLSQSENGFWKAHENFEGKLDKSEFQGRGRFDGRGRGRGRGGEKSLIREAEEELYDLLGMTPEKRFRFDIANFQTPSGSFYCSHCDLTMVEEPLFLLHLGSKKHLNKIYYAEKLNRNRKGRKVSLNKGARTETMTIPTDTDIIVGRSH